ncbi:asparagine synthase (glutamine-hydrolyzing), partial [Candidatus Babeliales bacterium]|nr:asparagine synthase (glutamine-hydrolyzing) [Candidatus Babeliales bacterium]
MSGILGIVNLEENDIDRLEFKEMLDTLKHRGPDDEKAYFTENIALGYRKLATVNLIDGNQPISNEDETMRVVCDGIIFNFRSLRTELTCRGHKFKTNSDAEVVIHAYEEYGHQFLAHLNGIYSIAILDEKRRNILLARDRVGVRPLYFYFKNDILIFASEIKAIIKSNKIKKEPDYDSINDYLIFQYCLGKRTLFKNINRVLPGYYLIWNYIRGKPCELKQYWDVEYHYDLNHTEEYFIEKLRFLLEDSVKLNLMSDVPLGTYLSGGIDSSTTTCIAADLSPELKLKTFSGYYPEFEEYDETKYAKVVTGHVKGENYAIPIDYRQFVENISKIIYFMDEPQGGPGVFGQFIVAKEASKEIKVALSGEGGDEIFFGYAKSLIAYLEECINGAIMETADTSKYAVTLESIIPNLPILKMYKSKLQYFWREGLFEPQDKRYFRLNTQLCKGDPLINWELFKDFDKPFKKFSSILNSKNLSSYINKMSYYDLKFPLQAVLHVD